MTDEIPPVKPVAAAPQRPAPTLPQVPQTTHRGKPLPPLPSMVEAMRELVELGSDNPTMPEPIFIDFLRAVYDPRLDRFDTKLWYQTFGTYRKGVDITDGAGKVIHVCPPMMGALNARMGAKDKQPTITQVADHAALAGQRHRMLEARTFNDGIAKYKPEMAYDIRARWRALLEHYGILGSTAVAKAGLTPESLLSDEGDAL